MASRHFLHPVCMALGISLLSLTSLFAASPAPEDLVGKLQLSAGWTSQEPARVAVGDGLFELIDGGAELYHEYGFNRAVSWSIGSRSGGSIQVELYEMNDAAAAYGVWSLMQAGSFSRGTLGQGSLRFRYYVAFWSSACFGSVTGDKLDHDTQDEVNRLAAQLASLLPHDGRLPEWFGQLNSADLNAKMYVRGKIGLSNTPVGSAGNMVDGKEALVGIAADHRSLLYHFSSKDEASARLDAVRQRGSKNQALKSIDLEADGISGLLADGSRFAIRQKDADILVTVWPAAQSAEPDNGL
jgi:hypothetical protein